jgi:hypothetical protein
VKAKTTVLFSFILALFIVCSVNSVKARFNVCIDSNVVAPYNCFDTTWRPECGCNNITYRNDCYRLAAHVSQVTDRTCEQVTIVNVYPNPIVNSLNFRVYLKTQGTPYVFVYDTFGNLYFEKYYLGIEDDVETADLSNIPNGIYTLVAVYNGQFSAKKFMKLTF